MTQQQRKALIISAAILSAAYPVHSVVISVMKLQYNRQQAIRRAQKAKEKPSVFDTVPTSPPGMTPSAPLVAPTRSPGKLSGVWEAKTVLERRGICDLRFEVKESEPGHFTGYSTFSCINTAALVPLKDPAGIQSAIAHRMHQDAAILTGKMENGAIHFTVDNAIGTDLNGCAVTSFTVTPFGARQIAAEWLEGKCQGGSILLQRMRS